ncbi:MAG: RnfABCDGE type electron transport complex subunit D [Saccharofermentanales bacterium]
MNLQVSSSPHLRDNSRTSRIMLDVIIALVPALLAAVYFFGLRVILVVAATVGSSVLFEYLSRKAMKRDNTINDLSAVVTGILIAFSISPATPLWMCVVGSFIAIVVVKQMFGGLGNNFVNPAITARIIMAVSFPVQMGTWKLLEPADRLFGSIADSFTGADLVTTATPLYLASSGAQNLPSYLDLFIGNSSGCIGEVSVLAVLLGGAYLLARRVIKIWIPLSFIAAAMLVVFIAGGDVLYHLLSGGLMLGAFFFATDYVTSPFTNKGKVIFGIGCGLITGLIRMYGGMPEGVAFSILLMNILTPHIDNLTIPVPFGGGKKSEKQKA